MARESTQHKLDRVRPPRVQITYDVEVGDAIETKELPFVMGVVGNFTGMPSEENPLPPVKERNFVNIDRDNIDDVLKGMNPHLSLRVDNKLEDDGTQLGVDLNFKSREDFEPAQVVKQVEPLRQLLEVRNRLSDLKNKMYGNDKLEDLLQDVLQEPSQKKALDEELRNRNG